MKLIDMGKPKNMTPEQETAWTKRELERQRKYREANREKIREQNRKHKRKYLEANREKIREQDLKYREANPKKTQERHCKYQKANPEKMRKIRLRFYYKTRNQAAADQFFILSGAAQQISDIKLT